MSVIIYGIDEDTYLEKTDLAYEYEVVEDDEYVRVVRCPNCKHLENHDGYLYCTQRRRLVLEDDYCSWGEER